MKKVLKRILNKLYHFVDDAKVNGIHSGLSGDCSKLRGDCSGLWGDCSRLRGDCSGLRGNLNLVEKGVDIKELIK